MILVTGATGHLGRLVIDALVPLVGADQVVAGVRSPEKAADLGVAVRAFDYDDPATLAAALEGIDQLLLVSGSEVGRRIAQHTAVVEAAAAAGVGHLAYTSILGVTDSPLILAQEHRATEEAIVASGLTATFLRNGWYIENYTENLAPVLAHGAVIGSAGDGRIAAATRADYAAAAAAVLADPAKQGRAYELAGTPFTMAEYAAAVSAATGREIPYVDLPPADFLGALTGGGVPEPFAQVLVDADLGVAKGVLDGPSADLESLIGRPSTPLAEVVAAAVAAA